LFYSRTAADHFPVTSVWGAMSFLVPPTRRIQVNLLSQTPDSGRSFPNLGSFESPEIMVDGKFLASMPFLEPEVQR
jgi:hypothetical protein